MAQRRFFNARWRVMHVNTPLHASQKRPCGIADKTFRCLKTQFNTCRHTHNDVFLR